MILEGRFDFNMFIHATMSQWILGIVLILSALGTISLRKPIHASLSFLLSLMALATFYLELSAEFIAVMQVLVYAGAILVIFVFVLILFQDAHQQIMQTEPKTKSSFLIVAGICLAIAFILFWGQFFPIPLAPPKTNLPEGFGKAQGIGEILYLNFFFPFEAVILLFLVAIVGALYIAKREG